MERRRNWTIYKRARKEGWPKKQAAKYSAYKVYEGHREKPMYLWPRKRT
jgi:hypothetical protein